MIRRIHRVAMTVFVVTVTPALTSADLIYDNTGSAFTGHLSFTAQEEGDEIQAAGTARVVSLLEIGVNQQGRAGTADLQARLYANDGPGGKPGTRLWESAIWQDVALTGGNDLIPFVVPNVLVPDTFTWTIQISNASPVAVGRPHFGPASVGSSPDIAWFGSPGSWTTVGTPSNPVNYLARVTAGPEPSTMYLLGLGMACAVAFAAKSKSKGTFRNLRGGDTSSGKSKA